MPDINPIPDDRLHVVPYLCIKGASEAIDWYVKAFDAVEASRMPTPDGRVMHAEIEIGGHLVFMSDDFPEMSGAETSPSALGGTTVSLHRYVPDCDATVNQAVEAGAEILMPPEDMFWGDRFAKIRDPFGHEWSIATHVRDVSDSEAAAAGAAFFTDADSSA